MDALNYSDHLVDAIKNIEDAMNDLKKARVNIESDNLGFTCQDEAFIDVALATLNMTWIYMNHENPRPLV